MDELNATTGSFKEEDANTSKGTASTVALSTLAQTRGSGANTDYSVRYVYFGLYRIPRVFNGYEICEFSTHLPEHWSEHVRIRSLTCARLIHSPM